METGGRWGEDWTWVGFCGSAAQEAPPRGSRTRRLLAAARTGEVGAPGFGFGSGLRLRVGCATTVWGGLRLDETRLWSVATREGAAFFESPGSGPMERGA